MSFAGQQFSLLECFAFVTGLLSVWLTAKMRVSNWPIGIVSVACYFIIFIHVKLYADASLQIFFVVFGLYGWIAWKKAEGQSKVEIPTARISRGGWLMGIGCTLLATVAFAQILQRLTDSPVAWIDSSLTASSLLATWAEAKRDLRNWWVWIMVDVVSIPLYWTRHLPLTSLLYLIFLLICVYGLARWVKDEQRRALA
jgi:nicotinamide mononucleotide transporter